MPNPKDFETRDEFMSACIPQVIEDGTAEGDEQAKAVCLSMWDEAHNAYECECLECGHVWESDTHCRDAECPECGGEARRAERPGVNQLQFTVNQVASVSRKNIDGTEYLVAPIILIREGVLNGELVKASEFNRHYGSWNGRPFVVGHPRDKDENAVTANDPLTLAGKNPDVYGGLKVGELYNTEPLEDKLRSEIWVPIEQTRRKGGEALDVLQRLEKKERLEVSTAYWRDLEPRGGEWDGQPYNGVALNLKPDHVAGLLDAVGACSWQDGCGAPRLNEGACMTQNLLTTARTPDYSGANSGEWSRPSFEDFGFEASSVNDLSAEQKQEVASISLLGDPDADNFAEMTFFPVVSPQNRDLHENALDAVMSGRGAQADISEEALESAREKARQLLNKEFDRDLEAEQALNALQTIAKYARVIANQWGFVDPKDNDEEQEEGMEREALVEELLENTELSEEDLAAMSDCGLKHLASLVREPEPEPEEEPETNEPEPETNEEYVSRGEYQELFDKMVERIDQLEGELHREEEQQHNELVKSLAGNEKCAVSEEKLMAMDIETLEGLKQSLTTPNYSGAGGGPQSDGKDWVIYNRSLREVDNG